MEFPQLLSNSPTEGLNEENDLFGHLRKAKAIEYFLRNYPDHDRVKMIALYGNWGSGKTTLMRYLDQNLQEEFETVFFEAWRFEKDDNLAFSLATAISERRIKTEIEEAEEFLKSAFAVFKSMWKGVKIKTPLFELDNKTILEEAEKVLFDYEVSAHEKEKQFRNEYKKMEKAILGDTNKRLIVFVDDLDRCEPENIINLLSMLKLFFTYGERTIFFCGIDKQAVGQAIKTKYSDVVKAEEYLEKIFDINFKMPEDVDTKQLILHYFKTSISVPSDAESIYDWKKKMPIHELISDFLNNIGFTNPRHIKKVMNKFEILKWYRYSDLQSDIGINVTELMTPDGKKGRLFDTILTIYLIILHDYFPNKFEEVTNWQQKIHHLAINYFDDGSALNRRYDVVRNYINLDTLNCPLNEFNAAIDFTHFVYMFLPNNVQNFTVSNDLQFLFSQFDQKENIVLIEFCKFIYHHNILLASSASGFSLKQHFDFANTTL